MITISQAVERLVFSSQLIEEALSFGIVNLSALARRLKPEIEKSLMKPVGELAIVMALKRLSAKIEKKTEVPLDVLKNMSDITVRSNLVEYTFYNSDTLGKKKSELLLKVESEQDKFVTFTQGVFEVTIIVSSNLREEIETLFKDEKLVSKLSQLSAITIKLPKETVHTPGVYHAILRELAWRNINITEVVSTFSEFIIILSNNQITAAFSILKGFLWK